MAMAEIDEQGRAGSSRRKAAVAGLDQPYQDVVVIRRFRILGGGSEHLRGQRRRRGDVRKDPVSGPRIGLTFCWRTLIGVKLPLRIH